MYLTPQPKFAHAHRNRLSGDLPQGYIPALYDFGCPFVVGDEGQFPLTNPFNGRLEQPTGAAGVYREFCTGLHLTLRRTSRGFCLARYQTKIPTRELARVRAIIS